MGQRAEAAVLPACGSYGTLLVLVARDVQCAADVRCGDFLDVLRIRQRMRGQPEGPRRMRSLSAHGGRTWDHEHGGGGGPHRQRCDGGAGGQVVGRHHLPCVAPPPARCPAWTGSRTDIRDAKHHASKAVMAAWP